MEERRESLKSRAPKKTIPSIILHSRINNNKIRSIQSRIHNKKLTALSEEQQRPLFSVENTVVAYELDNPPPEYVIKTLSLGPKNSVLDNFDAKDILAELDGLLYHCKSNEMKNDIITDINIKTLNYIKKCKKMKSSRNIIMTKKYLKQNNLLAVPFDKGIGICVMKREDYESKLDNIINLPQFEKITSTRKNAKLPILKEEERIITALKRLHEEDNISAELYDKLKPKGSQPARLYGLAKVHKAAVPVRPVLSMPGSAYHKVGIQIADWLSVVGECKINTSTKEISESLNTIHLEDDEELVSFDVSSLYTNVPVMEAIKVCADLLYSGKYETPEVSKETFIELAKISSCEVIMSTHRGYYKQVDGLAMGSPPAPHFANGWLSQYDESIKGDSKLFARYMDDILQEIKRTEINNKLAQINGFHNNLSFTIEKQVNGKISFLDMQICCDNQGKLTSTWYNKPTDTGLVLNYHALAPRRYKRSVVSGFVYRVYRACSTWENFHISLQKAKKILERNQYPPTFYYPIIEETITSIIRSGHSTTYQQTDPASNESSPVDTTVPKKMICVQYRGKVTEDYARALHRCNAPCTVVMTLRKLKTTMPSLKPKVEKHLQSGTVYQINCSGCKTCYVGQTNRHILTRLQEHRKPSSIVRKHFNTCGTELNMDCLEILKSSSRGEQHLLTLEALFIEELKPAINTKDEYRSRTLTIRLY